MGKFSLVCLAAGLVGLTALPSFAALSSADRAFAQQAAASGIAEIEQAQLAQQRAGSPQVRQFASRMVTDHTQANDELQQIAQQEDITLSTKPSTQDAAATQRLRGLNGTQFDQMYAQNQVRDHQQAVALFRKEASSGQDPALKSFAQKTLPILQQHLQLAVALNTNR